MTLQFYTVYYTNIASAAISCWAASVFIRTLVNDVEQPDREVKVRLTADPVNQYGCQGRGSGRIWSVDSMHRQIF